MAFKGTSETFIRRQTKMHKIPKTRIPAYTKLLSNALEELPIAIVGQTETKNGEGLFHDEAEIQKRILSYRLAQYLKPAVIIESHPGLGVGSFLYRHATPKAAVLTIEQFSQMNTRQRGAFIDIDPFGSPWKTLEIYTKLLRAAAVVQVTNGEIYSVVRNWKRAQRRPTLNYGTRTPKWVVDEYIPAVEQFLGKKCQFFYAFPTSIRLIMSNIRLPSYIWSDCIKWLSWFGNRMDTYG
jgi:hypothetical protein